MKTDIQYQMNAEKPEAVLANLEAKFGSASANGSWTADNRLLNAVSGLMEIVEGVSNLRWQFEGRRLVDTPQWCDLHCAWCAEKRKSSND